MKTPAKRTARTASTVLDAPRRDRKHALWALEFLARTGEPLASALDAGSRMAGLARLVVPDLGDFCGVYFADRSGRVELAEVASVDPAHAAIARERLTHPAWNERRPHPVVEVVHTARSRRYVELTERHLARLAIDPEDLARLQNSRVRSWLCVPLSGQTHVLGAISVARCTPRPCFDRADVLLVEELGRRAAGAIEVTQIQELCQRERLRAEEASRLKNELLTNLSHELRTPLTPILGWASLLRTRSLPTDAQAHALAVIERNALVQKRLVEDLLEVSDIIAGAVTLEIAPVDPALTIETALAAIRPAAEAKGILAVSSVIEPGIGVIPGDASRLRQIVEKLLSNAVKFTPDGGSIEVRLERERGSDPGCAGAGRPAGREAESICTCCEDRARLSVVDTGAGIPADFLPHVFDRFSQADGSITRAYGGLGLGLAIARHLVELHGGSIEAHSAGEGLGATFCVRLPMGTRRKCGAATPATSPQPR